MLRLLKDTVQVDLMVKIQSADLKNNLTGIMVLILSVAMVLMLCSCAPDNSGFDGTRFSNTRKISVMTDSSDPELEKLIHDSVLKDCNIDVVFIPSRYYVQDYGIIPDVAYSSNTNRLTTYYRMDSILNMSPYLSDYGDSLKDLKDLLGDENLYSCSDDRSQVWYLTPKSDEPEAYITFIRKDWLDKLGLDAPDNLEEFHKCLTAFRDNADLLGGGEGSDIIPFFTDNEPNISCKPLFDSFYDTSIDDEMFYVNGYCRATQDGYVDGLKTLNNWYLEGLLPSDFKEIIPGTKESYEPIEKGYVGAFCSKYDYLYKNGDNSHINALHENCGDEANYIAVNTFSNANGEYTFWDEDYLDVSSRRIFLPSTCTDPLACLVYLNWLSDPSNVDLIRDNAVKSSTGSSASSYLLTLNDESGRDLTEDEYFDLAKKTASEVKVINRSNECVRYDPSVFEYADSEVDLKSLYPDSTAKFTCGMISANEGEFDPTYKTLFEEYAYSGAGLIYSVRQSEWQKVMIQGIKYPM